MEKWGPYSRVYHVITQDERFSTVYRDDKALAAWLRLLIAADQAWPSPAALPRWLTDKALQTLTAAGIVEVSGDYYRIHSLDQERQERKRVANAAASARWDADAMQTHSERNAGAFSTEMPSRAEPSIAKPSTTEPSIAREEWDGRDDLEAWVLAKHRVPTPGQRRFLDLYCDTFDVTGPSRAAKIILSHPDDPIAYLKEDRNGFLNERAEAIVVKPKPPDRRSGSEMSPLRTELAKLWREQQREGEA